MILRRTIETHIDSHDHRHLGISNFKSRRQRDENGASETSQTSNASRFRITNSKETSKKISIRRTL